MLLATCGVLFAIVGLCFRPVPDRVPEAMLLQNVAQVQEGDSLAEINDRFGFSPNASWLSEKDNGYVVWRFEVSDVDYANSQASYFGLMKDGSLKDGFLLYPIESAGGGMSF